MLSKGLAYEKAALRYLKKKGLSSITCNFRTKAGEIDLIMRDENTLVFIEVRYRSNANYGTASESITRRKQEKIIKTASLYLSQENLWDTPCRFDVVLISGSQENTVEQIQWLRSAFSA